MTMRSELAEAPAVVAGLLEAARAPLARVADEVVRRGLDLVVIAGRGTSDHAATYAQYVLGERNGLPVALAAPSLGSLYGHGPRFGRALVIGISQSGRSPDVVGVLEDAREQRALTLAITNDPASPLAAAADVIVPLAAGPELAVAATKTYVAELAVVALLSEALRAAGVVAAVASADPIDGSILATLPAALEAAVAVEDDVIQVARARLGLSRCAVLGRGYQYATILEWALKLKEVAGVAADPYSAADFEHGPISMIEPGFPVLAVVTAGPAVAGMASLLGRLGDHGADLLMLSDVAAVRNLAHASIALPAGVPEWLSPIVAIVPCQLFAYHLAIAGGRDPETPRHLNKVTLTR
ncbi:MAG TPA: SIS domain-containing protein [Candidatus Acidoferrum sp.]|nr:SIS domain-containing protein [Candidatus Acidoferrum sp.]